MEKLLNAWSIATGVIGGVLMMLFGGFDTALKVLLVLMILDYISGIVKAVYTKTLSSKIGFNGLLKKVIVLVMVCTATMIQQLVGDNVAIREIVIMFYIANEGISILENASHFVPMPQQFRDVLLQLRGDKKNDSN